MRPLKIIVVGTLASDPFAGMAWMHMQIFLGFLRLGHDVYYFEITKTWPYNPVLQTRVDNIDYAIQTAKAGEFIGNKIIYLEAGSGSQKAVSLEMIKSVAKKISIPLIVGGGIRSKKEIEAAYEAGADLVVIGTAFEENSDFFNSEIKSR